MSQKLFSVWEGVYQSFEEAGGDYDAFDSDIWIEKQKNRLSEALQRYAQSNVISRDYPLPAMVSILLQKQPSLKILDFGGGMGLQYLEIISKVPQAENNLYYYIVDGKRTIDSRPSELSQFKKLYFFDDLEKVDENMDLIHIGSTLQYIEDWKELLTKLMSKFQPTYFIFSDLLAGDIPTFVSHQIFYDKKIPHLFLRGCLESKNYGKVRDKFQREGGICQEWVTRVI